VTCITLSTEEISGEPMLRITVQDGEESRTIKLEGRIAGPWVAELERVWRSLAPSFDRKRLHLDLRSVDFVDAAGGLLLGEIYKETKASFVFDSPLTGYFAENAMRSKTRATTERG
jgi:hypothetical protein